jgi:hypothetical protein
MWRSARTVLLAAVVGAAALVPLFGDPRSTPVTHPLWGRMLLRALDMTDAVKTSTQASQVFATLAWRDSLALPADRYLSVDGASVREEAGQRLVSAGEAPGQVVYPVAVVQPGDYHLRARLAGSPDSPATLDLAPMAGGPPVKTFTLLPAAQPAWVFGGSAHLDPGAYKASFLLPAGCSLSQLEVAPPCVNAIEPLGGWRPTAIATVQDVALTSLKAIDIEHELPPAASPLEVSAADFRVEGPPEAVGERASAVGLEASRLRGGSRGLRALVSFDVPEAGLYSVSAFASPGSGQRWLADGCRKTIVCPGLGSGWRVIMTQAFSAGRHSLLVTLGDGASVEMVRVEQKKSTPADYVATLRRLGFDPGPDGMISRDKALEAMRFVRDRRRALLAELCGDTVVYQDTPTALPVQIAGPGGGAPGGGAGAGGEGAATAQPAIGTPLLPPQPPASPTNPGG